MTHERKAALVLMEFNKDVLASLDLDEFVIALATKSKRKLLLL